MSEPSASAAPHLRRLLDLLADDAPAEALGAVSSQARAAGVPAGDLAEVERATATALRIRGALRQHRRRELQLTALFDTAGDLAASRDLDDVLNAIVRRARMLLGTDTAYLTLPDEEAGDTYMRVTDGSVSVPFQRLRLSWAKGSAVWWRRPRARTRPPTTAPTTASTTPATSTPRCWTTGS